MSFNVLLNHLIWLFLILLCTVPIRLHIEDTYYLLEEGKSIRWHQKITLWFLTGFTKIFVWLRHHWEWYLVLFAILSMILLILHPKATWLFLLFLCAMCIWIHILVGIVITGSANFKVARWRIQYTISYFWWFLYIAVTTASIRAIGSDIESVIQYLSLQSQSDNLVRLAFFAGTFIALFFWTRYVRMHPKDNALDIQASKN